MKEEQVIITRWIRKKDIPIPSEFFREDELLCSMIEKYCEDLNLTPIYIDRNIAIFSNEYKGSYFEEDKPNNVEYK